LDVETTSALPGHELIEPGRADLADGRASIAALLVSIGAPRLRALGLEIPTTLDEPELALYRLLQTTHGDGAHSQYNALVRRLVSFERALACAK